MIRRNSRGWNLVGIPEPFKQFGNKVIPEITGRAAKALMDRNKLIGIQGGEISLDWDQIAHVVNLY